MSSTPVMKSNEVKEKVTPKSLPMKPKTMQCGIVGFLKKMELEGLLEASVCETLLTKLPLFGTVEEQLVYYDTNFDTKHIEQTYIKPRVQEHKKANKPKKEKKPRQKKATKTETEKTDKPETETGTKTPEKESDKKTGNPEKPVKKPRGRKPKETVVEFDYDENTVVKNLATDLEAETYIKTATPVLVEKPKKKRVTKKKVEDPPVEEPPAEEFWMICRNNTKYWTTDENEKNGDVYSFDGKDGDGDPSPRKKIGKLVDGELQLD
tara:strand:+ start:1184 stop:1978 length:795 start_codon:yes stop_codon:yes gene_type:complete